MSKEFKRTPYSEKLRDPRWQKMRLKILERDEWTCKACGDDESTLNVHHRWYERGNDPWDYPEECLVALCETCHEQETGNRPADEADVIAAARKKYFSFELYQLKKLILTMARVHLPEVQLSAIAWYLSDAERVKPIMEAFFAEKCPVPNGWKDGQ